MSFRLENWSASAGPFRLGPLSIEVRAGERWLVLGPNGAGKSTLLRSLAGIEGNAPPEGTRFSYLSADEPVPFPLTGLEMVSLGRLALPGSPSDHAKAASEALRLCEADAFADRDVRSLSGGERQRVRLARALAREPDVLLLDEALSRMDLVHQLRLADKLADWASRGNRAVLLVSHDLAFGLRFSTHVLLLAGGREVARGKLPDALTPEAFERAFPGVRFSPGSGSTSL